MMFFSNKNKARGWLFLVFFVCVICSVPAQKALALSGECWTDYPNVNGSAASLPGFPNATDFKGSTCQVSTQMDTDCTNKGMIATTASLGCCDQAGVDAKTCDEVKYCCLEPTVHLDCHNEYAGSDRSTISAATCVPKGTCTGTNKKALSTAGDNNPGGCDNASQDCCATTGAATTPTTGGSSGSSSGSGSSGGTSNYPTGATLPQSGSAAPWVSSVPGGMVLVACTQNGECSVQDLLQQGVNFSRWIMGLAGALFLVVFVYGGAMYLASFGNSAYVTKGKTALTRGAIGIVLVMGAWTIVSYVAMSLGYDWTKATTSTAANSGSSTGSGSGSSGSSGSGSGSGSTGGGLATGGKCHCTGNITKASGVLDVMFDSFCPDVKSYCPSCGNGQATCSIDVDKSQADCEQLSSHPDQLAQDLGVGSAMTFINVTGNCTYSAQ